ncbi:hypothetical protein D9M68_775370 [compost metagenome]
MRHNAGGHADAAVTQFDQVAHALVAAGKVVANHRADRGDLGLHVDEGDSNAPVAQQVDLLDGAGRGGRGADDDALHPHFQHGVEIGLFAIGIAIGRAEQDAIALVEHGVLDGIGQRAAEGRALLAQQDTDDIGLLGAERRGQPVGSVAQFGNGLGDGFAHCRPHMGIVVDHPRDGRNRHVCQPRDVLNCYHTVNLESDRRGR